MPEATSEIKKRNIVLCFEKPEEMDRDNIYVTLIQNQDGLKAKVESNEDFRVESHTSGVSNCKSSSNERGGVKGDPWLIPYHSYLRHLVDENNGEIDYFPLIKQGARAHANLREMKSKLVEIASSESFK